MKLNFNIYFEKLDIDIIPIFRVKISVPELFNMKYKFHYRKITIGFKWLTGTVILIIQF